MTPNWGGPTERAPKEGIPELRNSNFSDVRQHHRKNHFLRGFLNTPSVESVPGEQAQLFTEGFPIIFHEALFSSWNHMFFLLILSADFELGAECLPLGGLRLPGSALK